MKWDQVEQYSRESVVMMLIRFAKTAESLSSEAYSSDLQAQGEHLEQEAQAVYAAIDALGWCPIKKKWKESEEVK